MKARHCLKSNRIVGEIIVGDNGSTDRPLEFASEMVLRVCSFNLNIAEVPTTSLTSHAFVQSVFY
jgi:hypothetical protein